jgi:hypothetical protein
LQGAPGSNVVALTAGFAPVGLAVTRRRAARRGAGLRCRRCSGFACGSADRLQLCKGPTEVLTWDAVESNPTLMANPYIPRLYKHFPKVCPHTKHEPTLIRPYQVVALLRALARTHGRAKTWTGCGQDVNDNIPLASFVKTLSVFRKNGPLDHKLRCGRAELVPVSACASTRARACIHACSSEMRALLSGRESQPQIAQLLVRSL